MISLHLAKLSTARDASVDETKFSWSHETHDLTLVFQNYSANGTPSQLLKVVQGTQIRHLIEVERLVNEGNDLLRAMQEHGVELKHEQLPISALVRSPLIAFRWQLSDKKIRRLQLKFRSSNDYDTAYSHLLQLGLRMSATNASQSRPSTSTSTSTSTISASASTSSNIPYSQLAQTAGPSCPPSRLTEISNRPYTAVTAPTFIESQLQETAHVRPASAYTAHMDGARNRDVAFSGPLRPPEYFARPDSAASTVFDLSTSAYPSKDRSSMIVGGNPQDLNERPDTAGAALPPRRELPFPRLNMPRSAGSDGSRPSSRPSTGLMGPPPLPARVASLRPTSSRAANTETELPPLPKPTLIVSAQQQPSWMQQPPRTPNQDQSPPPSSQVSAKVHEDQENRPSSSSSANFSPLSYKRATSNFSPSARALSSLSNVAQNRRRTESQSPLSTPPTSSTFHPPQTSAQTGGVTQFVADNSLAEYAMQSEEDRRAALNEFIFQNLENENFIILLEDMETCWARVGLGMK